MANAAKPAKAAPIHADSIEFRKFAGLKNVVERERLGPDELEEAVNIDLDDVGQPHRRQGRRLVASGKWSGLMTSNEGRLYGILNGSLGRIYPNFNFAAMQGGFEQYLPLPIGNVQVGHKLYFSCREQAGIIDTEHDVVSPWAGPSLGPSPIPDPLDPNAPPIPALPAGTWWYSPVVNPQPTLPPIAGKILGPPPLAEFLAYFNGRIFLAEGKTVWHTELFNYNYVNKTKSFFQFEAPITMVGSVTDGVYVGTTEGLWFLSLATRIEGHPAGAFKRIRVMDSGVIPGSMVYIPGELANPAQVGLNEDTPLKVSIMLMTTAGYCVAQDGGQAVNFSEDKFIFPEASSASAMYRFQQGIHQYVVGLNSGGTPSTNARIGDHVDATLRKAGTWQEGHDCLKIVEGLSVTYIPAPATPPWLPAGASAFADFANGNYYAGGAVTTLAAVLVDPTQVSAGALRIAASQNPAVVQGALLSALIAGSWTIVLDVDVQAGNICFPLNLSRSPVDGADFQALFADSGGGVAQYETTVTDGSTFSAGGGAGPVGTIGDHHKLAFTLVPHGDFASAAEGSAPVVDTVSNTGAVTWALATLGSFPAGNPAVNLGGAGTLVLYSITVYPPKADAALTALST